MRLSAWLRNNRADFDLVLQVDEWMVFARSSGMTGQWIRYEVVEDVPAQAEDLGFGLRFNGAGTLWIGNFAFETVDPSVPLFGRGRMAGIETVWEGFGERMGRWRK